MKIKSGVWYWLAVASGAVGLLYGMGLEGSFQTGGTAADRRSLRPRRCTT